MFISFHLIVFLLHFKTKNLNTISLFNIFWCCFYAIFNSLIIFEISVFKIINIVLIIYIFIMFQQFFMKFITYVLQNSNLMLFIQFDFDWFNSISNIANFNKISIHFFHKSTILYFAVQKGNPEIVKNLLSYSKIDVNLKSI